ncbi:MAG: chemotaxis protein CheW [Candidatus Rokubacteria bacterium]|nr:chemotaxis protein CheW [Candidatus Rokubacteria bacterium]
MTTLPAESRPEARQTRACLVKLAGSRFAVEVRYAREVVVFDEHTMVPLAPSHLLGVVNLRGSVMPLVDIRPFLGLEAARAARETRALVVECDGDQAALLIDEVEGLEPLEGLAPAGNGDEVRDQDFSAGRLEREGGVVTLLDVRRILGALGGPTQAAPIEAAPIEATEEAG